MQKKNANSINESPHKESSRKNDMGDSYNQPTADS